MADANTLARLLDALAGDCENTDGWTGAAPDCRGAAALIRSQAEELERLRRALGAVTKTANLLYANAVGCATNHYGDDIHEHGLPGWLADCAKDIQAARAALGER